MRALWAPGTKATRPTGCSCPRRRATRGPSAPIPVVVGGNGERRTLRIAAELGDACNLTTSDPEVLRHKVSVLRAHCADVGRDPAEVAVTVLDLPVVGRDRDDVWARVERLRGRTPAAAFAARAHAGTVAEHRERHAALAELGVSTVFLSTPDLDGPEARARAGRAQRVNSGQLVALAVCLAVMVGANVWVHVGPRPLAARHRARWPRRCCCSSGGRRACPGRSWASGRGRCVQGLVWGGAGRGVRRAGVRRRPRAPGDARAVPRRPPPGRGAVGDPAGRAWSVPLGTVVFEEVAFRGVLWGLLEVGHGARLGDRASGGAVRALARAAGARRGPDQHRACAAVGRRAPAACGSRGRARWCSRRWPASCSPCCAGGAAACSRRCCCTGRPTALGVVAAALGVGGQPPRVQPAQSGLEQLLAGGLLARAQRRLDRGQLLRAAPAGRRPR